MTVRYAPGPVNRLADIFSRGHRQVDWKDSQHDVMPDDPDIRIGISALFPSTTGTEEASGQIPGLDAAPYAPHRPPGSVTSVTAAAVNNPLTIEHFNDLTPHGNLSSESWKGNRLGKVPSRLPFGLQECFV